MAFLITSGRFYGPPGGTLQTYAAGTLTPLATYTTQAGTVANPTTITIPSNGYVSVWGGDGLVYRMIVKDSAGVTVYDVDNVSGISASEDAAALELALATEGASTGAGMVKYLGPSSGVLARWTQDKLRDSARITPEDFGAVGVSFGGTANNCTAALTAWINSANANPGICHWLPPLMYGTTAALPTITASGAWIEGSGVTSNHDVGTTNSHSTIKALSVISSPIIQAAPVSGATAQRLDGLRICGINIDCAGVAAKGFLIKSARYSRFELGAQNATSVAVEFGCVAVGAIGESQDFQKNDIWLNIRQVEAPSGVPLRLSGVSNANVSLNHFAHVDITHGHTSAVQAQNVDNNTWMQLRCLCVGLATYSVEWYAGATVSEIARGETIVKFSANKAPLAQGTESATYPSYANSILALDDDNGTPVPIAQTGASYFWQDSKGKRGGSTGHSYQKLGIGDDIANTTSAQARLSSGSVHIVNGSNNHVQISDTANANRWGVSITSGGDLQIIRLAGSGKLDVGGGGTVKILGKDVVAGAADSGGAGYRVLTIAN